MKIQKIRSQDILSNIAKVKKLTCTTVKMISHNKDRIIFKNVLSKEIDLIKSDKDKLFGENWETEGEKNM